MWRQREGRLGIDQAVQEAVPAVPSVLSGSIHNSAKKRSYPGKRGKRPKGIYHRRYDCLDG